jgi:WD40 repeat protein
METDGNIRKRTSSATAGLSDTLSREAKLTTTVRKKASLVMPCSSGVFAVTEQTEGLLTYLTLYDAEDTTKLWSTKCCSLKFIDYCPTGNRLVTKDRYLEVSYKIWDFNAGNTRRFKNVGNLRYRASDRYGTRILMYSWDKHISVWNTDTGVTLYTISSEGCNKFCFSGDGSKIMGIGYLPKLIVWNSETGDVHNSFELPNEQFQGVISSVNGALCAARFNNGFGVWKIESGKQMILLQHQHMLKVCFGVNDESIIGIVRSDDNTDNSLGEHYLSCWSIKDATVTFTIAIFSCQHVHLYNVSFPY